MAKNLNEEAGLSQSQINVELVYYRLDQIDKKLTAMSSDYVTKEEFEDFKEYMHGEMRKIKSSKTTSLIVTTIITAFIVATVTYASAQLFRR